MFDYNIIKNNYLVAWIEFETWLKQDFEDQNAIVTILNPKSLILIKSNGDTHYVDTYLALCFFHKNNVFYKAPSWMNEEKKREYRPFVDKQSRFLSCPVTIDFEESMYSVVEFSFRIFDEYLKAKSIKTESTAWSEIDRWAFDRLEKSVSNRVVVASRGDTIVLQDDGMKNELTMEQYCEFFDSNYIYISVLVTIGDDGESFFTGIVSQPNNVIYRGSIKKTRKEANEDAIKLAFEQLSSNRQRF